MKKQLIHRIPNQVESWVPNTGNTKPSRTGMMRHKGFINALIFLVAGSLGLSAFILPPQARSQETTPYCEIALSNAKNRIEQGRDIIVEIDIKDGSEKYPDHPDGRPTIIWLIVEGSAAESVMESPVFQKAIASEIIKSCNSVGAVSFNRYQTGWIYTIGLMRDGTIQKFGCVDDPEQGSPSWGQQWWCD
ncbi:MAG TPA: hypothetical protein DCL61_19990 [Cyanobacteria bacterium UBA12227]|nr:hypothetical protein [Cyanobacteria bacterium UBA12227]HAX89684.1 hypothetical protein [Cyanobacteria bacterium UBA11370]HBY79172.1 hypothetical protein [Cyanobacteria bacterium UBA11148]